MNGHSVMNAARFMKRVPLLGDIGRYCLRRIELLLYGKVVVKEIDGIKYELDLSEMIDSELYFYGYYERETSRILRKYVKPDMTVVEVGANIGAHTFEIAKMLDPSKGRLFSFEPTEYAFNKLKKNHSLNGFTNVVLERVALSDTNGEKRLHRATSPETMPFKASWDKKTGGPKHRSIDTISFKRMPDYFTEKGIGKLDLLKIDVDGYELRVLKGARDTIAKYRPIIIIELGVTVERVGDSLEELICTLCELGYSLRCIESGTVFDAKELIETVRQRGTMDCLCLPD